MIYDCFTYFNEKEVLDIRINELLPLGVKHVLVESTHTFVGNPKEIKKHDYPNVIHEIVTDMPNNGNPWDNEKHQRNCIKRALLKISPNDNDIIIISDVDEVPNADAVRLFNYDGLGALKMDLYSGYLNLLQSKQIWNNAKIMKWAYLKSRLPEDIRHEKIYKQIDNGGWHLSWMGDAEKQIIKFKNFSHQESSVQKHANIEILRNKREIGQSLWSDDFWEFVSFNGLPKYVQENTFKFKKLLKMNHFYQTIGEDWFTYPNLYKSMVEKFDNAHFVEVGSWKGRSASFMAVEIFNSGKNIKFDCVDLWEYSESQKDLSEVQYKDIFKQFMEYTFPVKDIINPIKGNSVAVAKTYKNKSLDFVFIDAAHDYDNVKADINAWLPKVKKGGVIAGHDYDSSNGVRQAVQEIISNFTTQEGCWVHVKK